MARPGNVRPLGAAFIVFAIAFNPPYAWLASNFDYPGILRRPAGRQDPHAFGTGGNTAMAVAGLGIGAAITQAIGLARWVYAVPELAAGWIAGSVDPALRSAVETTFTVLHQFAGVGIGEALGQTLTAFWLIGVALAQWHHPRFGAAVAAVGLAGGVILLFGLVEGLSG